MTLDEAKRVARVIAQADNGCSGCVGELVDEMNKAFPDFIWTLEDETLRDEEGLPKWPYCIVTVENA